ncbi:MAG: PD40 domain-containing protein [Planctomycetes bacterium]|nr:PD40 domain-containing protein [Planctomycetota bacterium]
MNRIVFGIILFLIPAAAHAQDPVRFVRGPDISPDGKTVAFSYLGDIWLVDVNGGVAKHLTMHEKHDYIPVFSPDGKWIAFSSNRHGQYDVFVISVNGGRPKRLTFDSADDYVTGWSPDSQHVLFQSGRSVDLPFRMELYSVPLAGGQAKQVSAFEGREGVYSPKGDKIAYVRGPGTWYRKGYKGSSNDDIWICNADGSNNQRVTKHPGQDSYPMWAADGKSLYYVSDVKGGLANIVNHELGDVLERSVNPVPVTQHKDDFVRRARICAKGEVIVYECGPDIWVHTIKDGKSRKMKIGVQADDKANPEIVKTFTTGATEFAWSPDEKHIAFVVHGEIFLMGRDGGKAKRLTNHPAFDHGIAWAPDGKKILFLSDRGGHEDIYALESDDPDHRDIVGAHKYKVKQITDTPEAEVGVSYSPDGQRVVFVRAGKLIAMDPDGTNEKVIVNDGQVFDYEWSPDGQWICYARMDGSFASELFIIPSVGATFKNPARNITRFATYNGGISWSRNGSKIAFVSARKGNQTSAYVMALQKPLGAGAFPTKDIDWENIHLRVKHPANGTVTEVAISADGSKIAFRGTIDDVDDLWLASSDGGSVQRLTTGGMKPAQITWSRYFPSQIYFRDGSGNIRAVMIGGQNPVGPNIVPFSARMNIRQDELFLEMFDQSWRALNESFYDNKFHGADWRKVRAKYRPLVAHCELKEDLYTLISLMLGELNASHLGISGNLGTPEQQTAELGLIFDVRYPGPDLKVLEVLKGGPADRRGINIKPGDRIYRIDGVDLTARTNISKLLNDKVGEIVVLHIADADAPGGKRRVEVRGENRAKINEPMYERWIKKNADRVTELSKGRLGYIHIPNMQEPGLDRFIRTLYSDNFDKDGIVLDVRFNGGGFTHDQVLNYLTGKEHTIFSHRDGSSGLVLRSYDRKWTKPLTLLINNRSYSDAEIFPHAFRTWGLGKLVGQPTGGFVIGTRNVTLIDGSTFRTPRIGVHTVKGINMEKEGVRPDVLIEPHPDDLARGIDVQLEKAIEVLTQDVVAWKKARPPSIGAGGN